MVSWYVAHIFSKWLWNSPSRPYYYWYHLLFFTFHMRCISVLRSLYFRIFSACFLITFLSPEITTFINIHVPFSLSRLIMSGLLLGIVLSVYTCWFHSMVTLPSWLFSTDFGTCSYQCFLSNCTRFLIIIIMYIKHWSLDISAVLPIGGQKPSRFLWAYLGFFAALRNFCVLIPLLHAESLSCLRSVIRENDSHPF